MPSKNEYVLAIDAGGTKCEALLMTTDGAALGFNAMYPEGVSESGGYGRGRDAASTYEAIKGALREVVPVGTLHLVNESGRIPDDIRQLLRVDRVLPWSAGEAAAAMAWAGVDEALVALAGTGAFGHLRAKGVNWFADGLGPLVGDWGSAYQIGREGLRAALRPGARTALRGELAAFAGVSGASDAHKWGQLEAKMAFQGVRILADRTAVASYAAMVDRIARAGDSDAVAIIQRAADDLSETLRCLVDQADADGCKLPLIGTGGVTRHSDIFWERLVAQVAVFMPGVLPLRQDLPQASGRALTGLAQAIQAGACTANLTASRDRLLASLPPLLSRISDKKGTL